MLKTPIIPKRNRFGFTLIELLIVVAIIGILAAIAVPNFMNARIRAKVSRAMSDQRTISMALENYMLDRGTYPYTRATSANNFLGYEALTTPVAYLNSPLNDPFSSQYVSDRGDAYDPYYEFYCTCLNGSKNNMFNIECIGPDGVDSFNPTSTYPYCPSNFEFYDASNGLVSPGEILKAGGVYIPRWYRERKGASVATGENWL
ncbi:MAG: prepilin-type N-terminal cleavage/methylation domain-containing protein [bacterium]